MAEGDVPPLEDMSHAIQASFKCKSSSQSHLHGSYLEVSSTESEVKEKALQKLLYGNQNISSLQSQKAVRNEKSGSSASTYCGFKKGFLLSQPSKKKSSSSPDLVEVTKSECSSGCPAVFPEVQAAMANHISSLTSKDWVTDDLLDRLQKNTKLANRLGDHRVLQALELLQKDPRKAMLQFQSDPDMKDLMQEFCALMSDHFTTLAEMQNKASGTCEADIAPRSTQRLPADVDEQVKEILSNAELVSILQDSEIQRLLSLLKTNPSIGQRYLMAAGPDVREKVRTLISAGLLQVQQQP